MDFTELFKKIEAFIDLVRELKKLFKTTNIHTHENR